MKRFQVAWWCVELLVVVVVVMTKSPFGYQILDALHRRKTNMAATMEMADTLSKNESFYSVAAQEKLGYSKTYSKTQ